MPRMDFSELPLDARIWIFGSDRPLTTDAERALLAEVDGFLERWAAHGEPLRSAREWRDGRFLVIGVDHTQAHASGCSVDGLFRAFQRLEPEIDARLLGGGRVFYRTQSGEIASVARDDLKARIAAGEITSDTMMFDTTLTSLRDYRGGFERPVRDSWMARAVAAVR